MKNFFYIICGFFIFLQSCKKSKPDYPLTTDKVVQIQSSGCEITFSVPRAYNTNTQNYVLTEGSIVFSPLSCLSNETIFREYYFVHSGDIPNVVINNNQNGIAFFKCSINELLKDALVKFPFENVNLFNSVQQYKPYRIKIDNFSNMLTDMKDSTKWEPLPIIKIDSIHKQVHFYSRKFDGYVYCIAKR
ncbi:MAG: hypothetical protein ACK5D5_06910 [Bacteroidota bacterium]|jgi:hypothetical protein